MLASPDQSEIDIDIDVKNVYSHMGYAVDCIPSPKISSLVNDYVENAQDLIQTSYSWAVRDVQGVYGSSVFLDDSIVFESEVISGLLELSQKVAVFVVTIGDQLEVLAESLAEEKHILQATVLEAAGSEAVEKAADHIHCKVGEYADCHDLVISRRFSPGYCDWDIEQQRMVFRAVGDDNLGVDLMDSCLMVPRKSISGIIGIGTQDANLDKYNPCRTCSRHDCVGRR
ncbi:MAG: vitamin B12 dependent-methionine synthase activation domain-containing protein [Chloroflexota bacterium]|nr:vitamin B12 dependent-methionine synthase activation domain-containing protein [Chloroflexota bacterium]